MPVHPADGLDLRLVATIDLFQRGRDLADCRLMTCRLDRQRHQVVVQATRGLGRLSGAGEIAQRRIDGRLITLCPKPFELLELFGPHLGVFDLENLDLLVVVDSVLVHADEWLLARVDARLRAGGSLLDAEFRQALVDGLRHAAGLLHLRDVATSLVGELGGEPLDVVRPRPWIDGTRGARLLLEQQLRVAGDSGREVGRQSDGLVERVGVQRLRVPLRRSHCLDTRPCHVVEDVLRRQRPSGRLRMRAQRQRFRVLRAELRDQFAPQQPCGTKFRDLHEEVHADAPEERESGRELVDVEARLDTGADVLDAVGECVGQLEIGGRSGLLDVVAGDRYRVELRHLRAGVGKDVGDDPHGGLGRIDVGVADHELFEDVVLDGSGQLLRRHALLFGGNDIQRQDRQHGAVHRHRHRDCAQVDAVEELTHVEDRVDRDTRHTHVTCDARMVGVVAAVGCEVEGDRQSFLAGRQIASVEGVRFRSRREARVLTNCPRLVHIHRGVGTPDEGGGAGDRVERIGVLGVAGDGIAVSAGVDGLDVDLLGCAPDDLLGRVAVCRS